MSSANVRKPLIDPAIFKKRRAQLAPKIKGAAVILTAAPDYIRNYDVHHYYRQDSNFFYMTGFEEQESIFIFRPGQTPETIMFVRKKDPVMETWDGFRYGPQMTESVFGIDKCFLLEEFDQKAPELLKDCDKVYYSQLHNPYVDQKIHAALINVRHAHGRKGLGNMPLEDSYPLIGEMRIVKSTEEIEWMRKSSEINTKAHIEIMRAMKPNVSERYLYGVFMGSIFKQDCPREAYQGIFASGANATTLHYTFNDAVCKDGDLFLVDAGCEYNYMASDITRCYPVNGKFSAPQKDLYNEVLKVQKELIEKAKPGVTLPKMQEHAVSRLTDVMLSVGLLKGSKETIIEKLEYKKYYPHGVSHLLGMDVHDAGLALKNNDPRPMEVGMSFTVEPGLYVPIDDQSAPKEFRGIGIRIEDDVVVTGTGCEVLTGKLPKDVSELESIVGKS